MRVYQLVYHESAHVDRVLGEGTRSAMRALRGERRWLRIIAVRYESYRSIVHVAR